MEFWGTSKEETRATGVPINGGSGHHLHSGTHLTAAHRFTLRGYELFRHDRADRRKGGIVTLVRNTIPDIEVGRSEVDGEYLAIRVVVQFREITVINYYCPPDRDLQLHTIPLVNHNLLITGDFNGHSPSWGYADLNSRGEQIEDWMIENDLILINRPDDQPTHLSRTWKTLSTPDLAIASEDIQKICDREVHTQLGGSDHLPVLLKVTLTEHTTSQKKEPSWNYKKANWLKFQNLTYMLCRELDTDNSKNINASVQQLTECILQAAKQAIPRGRRKDYKPYWSNRLHDQLAEARKRFEQLPSPEHTILYNKARAAFDEEKNKEARKSWQEKTGSLNTEKDTQKLWNLTKALNDDQQHASRAALLKEVTQIFTGKKAAYLLADSFREESLLDISREKQADIRMKTKKQVQKQSPAPSMTSEFSIHELNCAIRQLKKQESPKEGWHFQ